MSCVGGTVGVPPVLAVVAMLWSIARNKDQSKRALGIFLKDEVCV